MLLIRAMPCLVAIGLSGNLHGPCCCVYSTSVNQDSGQERRWRDVRAPEIAAHDGYAGLRTDFKYSSGLLAADSLPRMISLPNAPAGGLRPISRMILAASVASMTCWASFL